MNGKRWISLLVAITGAWSASWGYVAMCGGCSRGGTKHFLAGSEPPRGVAIWWDGLCKGGWILTFIRDGVQSSCAQAWCLLKPAGHTVSCKSLALKSFSPGRLGQLCCWPWWKLLVSTLNSSCPKAGVLGSAAWGNLRFCSTHFICGMSRPSLAFYVFSLSYCIPLLSHLAHHRVHFVP